MSLRNIVLSLVLMAGLGACSLLGDPQERKVRFGVDYAKSALTRASGSGVVALALQNALETGGTPASFLIPGISDPAEHPHYEMNRPTQPGTVVIRSDAKEWIIEGYAADLKTPLLVEHAPLPRQ